MTYRSRLSVIVRMTIVIVLLLHRMSGRYVCSVCASRGFLSGSRAWYVTGLVCGAESGMTLPDYIVVEASFAWRPGQDCSRAHLQTIQRPSPLCDHLT